MNVLIAVDFSKGARSLPDKAAKLLRGALGRVWLLHVAEPEPDFVGFAVDPLVMREQVASEFHREHRQLQAMAEDLRGQGVEATALLIQGATASTIIQQAVRLDADLIVVGTHRPGLLRPWLAGEWGEEDLTAAGKPVLLMPV